MSIKERESRYREAIKYFENAADILRTKASKKDKHYQNVKYVRMACGTAYNGLLLAVDTYLEMKGKAIKKPGNSRIDISDYRKAIAGLDKKLLNDFNNAYNLLHLSGYYDGVTRADVIRGGLESGLDVVNKIKPPGLAGLRLV